MIAMVTIYMKHLFRDGVHIAMKSQMATAVKLAGEPNCCTDLIDPRDSEGRSGLQTKTVKRLYFKLSSLEQELKQYIRTASMPSRVYNLCCSLLDKGLPDICISHPGKWGIRHDLENYQDHVVYVWFEMAFGYLWQAGQSLDRDDDVWDSVASVYDGSREVVHTYGFDNAFYHALLFPAVYYGLGKHLKPPQHHIVNELLDLDGKKFSTSRGHLIWGRELLSVMPADYVRFVLARHCPEGQRDNFDLECAASEINKLFHDDLDNWIKCVERSVLNLGNILPEPGAWLFDHQQYYQKVLTHSRNLMSAQHLESFSLKEISTETAKLIEIGSRFANSQVPLLNGSAPNQQKLPPHGSCLDCLGP